VREIWAVDKVAGGRWFNYNRLIGAELNKRPLPG
jgi:hypothetical protein